MGQLDAHGFAVVKAAGIERHLPGIKSVRPPTGKSQLEPKTMAAFAQQNLVSVDDHVRRIHGAILRWNGNDFHNGVAKSAARYGGNVAPRFDATHTVAPVSVRRVAVVAEFAGVLHPVTAKTLELAESIASVVGCHITVIANLTGLCHAVAACVFELAVLIAAVPGIGSTIVALFVIGEDFVPAYRTSVRASTARVNAVALNTEAVTVTGATCGGSAYDRARARAWAVHQIAE